MKRYKQLRPLDSESTTILNNSQYSVMYVPSLCVVNQRAVRVTHVPS
jgi:hypothetical protein